MRSVNGGLGFFDDEGDGVTEEQLILFKNAINSASSFYRNDDEKRLKYIADQMDKAFSEGDKKFEVYQDGLSIAEYALFIDFDETFASIQAGSDRLFPNRSYMFNRMNMAGKTPAFFPITGAKGNGITDDLEKKLISTIAAADDGDYCDCGDAIWSLFGPLFDWSFLCYDDPTDVMYYAYAVDEQYYSAKGKNCYFAMWRGE